MQTIPSVQYQPLGLRDPSNPMKGRQRQVNQRNPSFLLNPVEVINRWKQRLVSFVFTIVAFITSLPFRIGLRILDLIERGIRYLVWLNIKGVVAWINLVYRFFAFFRMTKAVKLLEMIAKNYFREYSAVNFDRQEEHLSRLALIMRKKDIDLINVDKFEKRIKTPSWFIKHKVPKIKEISQQQEVEAKELSSQGLVRQGDVKQFESKEENSSPRLVRLSQSHDRIKKKIGEQSQLRNTGIAVEIPPRASDIAQNRNFPDRDISPQRYMKPIPRIEDYEFDLKSDEVPYNPMVKIIPADKKSLDKQAPKYPSLKQSNLSQRGKLELERELINLRQKMQDLIYDNNKYIKQLQEWLGQKTDTIMNTRTQNIQLLQEIQSLQKENIQKSQKLTELQQRVKEMEEMVNMEKTESTELCYQIAQLNYEVKAKSFQMISLKDKMNWNLQKIQQNQPQLTPFSYNQNQNVVSPNQNTLEQTTEDETVLQNLRKAEERTAQLEEKVQKVLKQQRQRLQKTEIKLPLEKEMNLLSKGEGESTGKFSGSGMKKKPDQK